MQETYLRAVRGLAQLLPGLYKENEYDLAWRGNLATIRPIVFQTAEINESTSPLKDDLDAIWKEGYTLIIEIAWAPEQLNIEERRCKATTGQVRYRPDFCSAF